MICGKIETERKIHFDSLPISCLNAVKKLTSFENFMCKLDLQIYH